MTCSTVPFPHRRDPGAGIQLDYGDPNSPYERAVRAVERVTGTPRTVWEMVTTHPYNRAVNAAAKELVSRAKVAALPRCHRGHLQTAHAVTVDKHGNRRCGICIKERKQRNYLALKAQRHSSPLTTDTGAET